MNFLKPCRVCKSTDIIYYTQEPHEKSETEWWFVDKAYYHIECNNCGHTVVAENYYDAVNDWNRGQIPPWEQEYQGKRQGEKQ